MKGFLFILIWTLFWTAAGEDKRQHQIASFTARFRAESFTNWLRGEVDRLSIVD